MKPKASNKNLASKQEDSKPQLAESLIHRAAHWWRYLSVRIAVSAGGGAVVGALIVSKYSLHWKLAGLGAVWGACVAIAMRKTAPTLKAAAINAALFSGAALATYGSLAKHPTDWLACGLLGALAGLSARLWLAEVLTWLEKGRM